MSRVRKTAAAVLLLVALGGCHTHDEPAAHDHSGGEYAFGAPGDPSDADVTVEVVADDPYRFFPSRVEVGEGDTVTFTVTNEGKTQHEFVLGDEAFQEEHEGMDHGEQMSEPYGVSLEPGETKDVTWTFAGAGEVLFACHEAGHYDGGMIGVVEVNPPA